MQLGEQCKSPVKARGKLRASDTNCTRRSPRTYSARRAADQQKHIHAIFLDNALVDALCIVRQCCFPLSQAKHGRTSTARSRKRKGPAMSF